LTASVGRAVGSVLAEGSEVFPFWRLLSELQHLPGCGAGGNCGCGRMKMEAGCLLSWSCPRIYSWPGWWKTSESPWRCWGGLAGWVLELPPSSPDLAAGGRSPALRGRGWSAHVLVGWRLPPAAAPLPPPLFIAFRQHLELELIRRWGTELGETCVARGGGGPPSPSRQRAGGRSVPPWG